LHIEDVVGRVHCPPVDEDLVMEMGSRRKARTTDLCYLVTAAHRLAHTNQDPRGMCITSDITITMIDLDHPTIVTACAREGHLPLRRRQDRRAVRRGDIHTDVRARPIQDRM